MVSSILHLMLCMRDPIAGSLCFCSIVLRFVTNCCIYYIIIFILLLILQISVFYNKGFAFSCRFDFDLIPAVGHGHILRLTFF